jgi:hypothetical protein
LKITIGFIASDTIAEYMRQVGPELAPYCRILTLRAADSGRAIEQYRRHVDKVDCVVFSGKAYYYTVLSAEGSFAKPCYFLDESMGDIKELLLRLLLGNRDFDFSRVFVDMANERNDWLGIKALLPEGEWPYFADSPESDPGAFSAYVIARHRELHEKGLIDLSITRFGALLGELEAAGIPYVYAYPSREYVVNFFMQIVNAIALGDEAGKRSGDAFGAVAISFEGETEARARPRMLKCTKLLADYVRLNGYDFVIQREGEKIVVLSQYGDIAKITKGFSDCGFKAQIEKSTGHGVFVGIGTGRNIYQAKLNSFKAADLSRSRSGKVFHIDGSDKMVGPIGEGRAGVLEGRPSARLLAWSAEFHVDHVNLQKIIAFAKVTRSSRMTAEQLAQYMGITLRSANRLLNRIESSGGAACYYEKMSDGRGRPRKCYDLTFIAGGKK